MPEDSKTYRECPAALLPEYSTEFSMAELPAPSAPRLSSLCSHGVLPLQSITGARVRRHFPYLGPGGRLMQLPQVLFPFWLQNHTNLSLQLVETTCLSSGCEQQCAELGDHKERTAGLFFFFLLFINSFFSLEVELTFFDLINYKLILRGNFLHCTLSLKICSKCQEHPPSRLLCLALELRKDTEKDKNSSAPAFLH